MTLCYLVYRFFIRQTNVQHLFLLASSVFFYTVGSGWHLLLLLYSGFCDFYISKRIDRSERYRKSWLALSIFNNLGLLFAFKYLDFFIGLVNDVLKLGFGEKIPVTNWLLPIGISFYTFQTMSYSFDVYYKRLKPSHSLRDYLLYVTFFPQLVAGPILRAQAFIPQLSKAFQFKAECFYMAIFFILLGLLKKVVIADSLGVLWVDPVYGSVSSQGGLDILLSTYAYAFQIYNDFSGYSDIAIGSALLLGFKVPVNFDRPFSCSNPSDFWNRWHISLSHWVRDYLFYPLMMKSRWKGMAKLNLFVTTLLIGIWHGANVTFVLFGLWHGLLAVLHQWLKPFFEKLSFKDNWAWKGGCWLLYFHFICLGMMMFRAESVDHFKNLFTTCLRLNYHESLSFDFWIVLVIVLAILTHLPRAIKYEAIAKRFTEFPLLLKLAITWCCLILFFISSQMAQGQAAFIYFRF